MDNSIFIHMPFNERVNVLYFLIQYFKSGGVLRIIDVKTKNMVTIQFKWITLFLSTCHLMNV